MWKSLKRMREAKRKRERAREAAKGYRHEAGIEDDEGGDDNGDKAAPVDEGERRHTHTVDGKASKGKTCAPLCQDWIAKFRIYKCPLEEVCSDYRVSVDC